MKILIGYFREYQYNVYVFNDRESYDYRKCDNDRESYRVPKKSGPKYRFFGYFLLLDGSIWAETVLYDQGIPLRRSGHPTCLYSEKILGPRMGPQN